MTVQEMETKSEAGIIYVSVQKEQAEEGESGKEQSKENQETAVVRR